MTVLLQDTKACNESGGTAQFIHNFSTIWKWVIRFRPRENDAEDPPNWTVGGPQSRPRRFGEKSLAPNRNRNKIPWIKRDQLDDTCFIISLFTAQHVSDVNTSIVRNLRLIWWVILWVVLLWFDVCWCYVVVWLGWCGIRMQASSNKSQVPDDGCINIRNMLSSK